MRVLSLRPLVAWLIGFCLLGLLFVFCWLFVRPYLEVRNAVDRWYDLPAGAQWQVNRIVQREVERLGGPEAAARKLAFYIRLPKRVADGKSGAVVLLTGCGAEAVAYLLLLLEHSDSFVRIRAVEGLAFLRDARAVDPLISTLKGADIEVRECAAEALGKLGDPRSVEPLIAALGDEHQRVRLCAVEALGRIDDQRALAPLEAIASDDPSFDVRAAALVVIGKMRKQPRVPAVPEAGR